MVAANNENKKGNEKQADVRLSNITAAKALADSVRTSLGPRGMDKMIVDGKGEVIVSNDGATIMNKFDVTHPCAKMLVDLSKAQDVEAGDGTTSVVVLCGSLLRATEELLSRGIHPTQISESFHQCVLEAEKIVSDISKPIKINEKEPLVKAAITSLNSKVVSSNSALLAPMAVEAVRSIIKSESGEVDLKDIRVTTSLGGTVEDTEFLTDGMIFKQKASSSAGGPTKISNANIALIQFQLSPPKTDMESTVIVSDYSAIDRAMKEERKYILGICKKIQESGCNVLLVQKSILRDAVTSLSLDILAKMHIMVVKDIERNDVPFICKTLGLLPIANLDNLKPEKFGKAEMIMQESTGEGRVVRVQGIKTVTKAGTASIFIRGSNNLMLAEAERSFHDALCVVRSIAKKPALIVGGAAAEIEVSLKLGKRAREIGGILGYCMRAYADAFEILPYTLAENAGLNPVAIVTELRNAHSSLGKSTHGINVRKGCVTDMEEEGVVQPLLVTTSAMRLATECVCMILKIDDIVLTR